MSVDETTVATPAARQAVSALTLRTDELGRIASIEGSWLGTAPVRAATVHDLVHPDDHDAIDHVLRWLSEGGSCDYGLNVHLRGALGWDPATMVAATTTDGFLFVLVPVVPDPAPSMLEMISESRDIGAMLDEALAAFADLDVVLWATVHYHADDGRFTKVVSTTGMDTFRRAIEAAMAGEAPCPWDLAVNDDEIDEMIGLADFSDGIHLAGRHGSIHGCRIISVTGRGESDVARIALWAESRGQLESPTVFALLERVVPLVAMAFQYHDLREELERARQRDGLTGLLNRQAFFVRLNAPKTARRHAVASIDIDGFRAVNEWKGHGAGDELLMEIARRLTEAMRPGDAVARMAGDEFAMLLADIKNEDAAHAILARIAGIFERPFVIGGSEFTITATTGLALGAPERTGRQLFDAAHRTRIEAKAEGRGAARIA